MSKRAKKKQFLQRVKIIVTIDCFKIVLTPRKNAEGVLFPPHLVAPHLVGIPHLVDTFSLL